MHNNITDMLGFKDRDIKVNVSKSSPSSIEITISKICRPRYCTICNHRMYSRGPYTRTLNHPILQDGRTITIKLRQRRWKCTNPVCQHFETEQFSFIERYKHNTNMTDFMIVEDFRKASRTAAEIAARRNVSDTYAIYTFARYDVKMARYMTIVDYEEALFKIDPVFKILRDLKEIYIRFNNRYVGKPKEAANGLRGVIE